MEKINWTDRVKNKEVLQSVKEERYILHTIKRRITGLATSCVGLPSEKTRRWRKTEGPRRRGRTRSGYYMTLRQGKDTGTWKRKH